MSFEAASRAAGLAPALSQRAGNMEAVTPTSSIEVVAALLAGLLLGESTVLADGEGSELEFEVEPSPRRLDPPSSPAPEVWAVDGGQALVADARCLQVVAARSATVCFRDGSSVVEEVGDLRAHLLGAGPALSGLADLGLSVPDGTPVDVNLLRDWAEWQAVGDCVERAAPGALVLVDGDLVPDWRIPSKFVSELLQAAEARGVHVVGVTKHTSLSRGGAPLIGQLEIEAADRLGRARWWAPVGRTRPGSHWPDLQVVVACLDPDARFGFRVDLPRSADPESVLGRLAAVCNDAAFPGYPYPLSVADRLAACPGWVRAEAWLGLEDALERAGVPSETRQRAFDDRHRLMERS